MGKIKRSDNSLTQHMRIKHFEHYAQYKTARAKDNGDCKTDTDPDCEVDHEVVAVHKKRSMSTNYDDDTMHY